MGVVFQDTKCQPEKSFSISGRNNFPQVHFLQTGVEGVVPRFLMFLVWDSHPFSVKAWWAVTGEQHKPHINQSSGFPRAHGKGSSILSPPQIQQSRYSRYPDRSPYPTAPWFPQSGERERICIYLLDNTLLLCGRTCRGIHVRKELRIPNSLGRL